MPVELARLKQLSEIALDATVLRAARPFDETDTYRTRLRLAAVQR